MPPDRLDAPPPLPRLQGSQRSAAPAPVTSRRGAALKSSPRQRKDTHMVAHDRAARQYGNTEITRAVENPGAAR